MPDSTPAGATPVVDGATPSQSQPAQPATAATTPAATPATPAMGDTDALGEPGKRALEAERARAEKAEKDAKALQKQLDDLKAAGQTDAEKAISAARKEGESTATTRWQVQIRSAEVRAALAAAGIQPAMLDLAVKADEFGQLEVSDTGGVTGLAAAVEGFKKARPALFTGAATPAPGSFDTGTGGGRQAGKPTYTRDQLKDPAFYEKNKADILLAYREGRIQQ